MAVKVYDSSEVTVNFAGVPLESGYADGEFVRIAKENDDFTAVEGTDGEIARSKTNSRLTTVTLIFLQTSDSNDKLAAIRELDRLGTNGAGIGPLTIRDRQGRQVFFAESAWIQKVPDVSFDREATSREWTLQCEESQRFDGGSQ